MNQTAIDEATTFTTYLVHKKATPHAKQLYATAISGTRDDKIVRFARKHRWSVGFLDAGSALLSPHCELRRRLYLMFAILETQPGFADDFLPQQRSPLYILVIGWIGIRSILRAAVGVVLVKVLS